MIVPSTNDNGLLVRFEKLPIAEAQRWHAAFVETDGQREVKSKQAGRNGVCRMTLNEFCDEVEGRISRWLHGRYEVCEAAQIMADANPGTIFLPGISAEGLCRQMEDEIHAGKLTVRLNGIPVPASSFTQYRLSLQTVLKSDVDEWLKSIKAGYTFDYPYETLQTDLQAAQIVNEKKSVIHSIKRRRNILSPVIELAQGMCRDPQDDAEVWGKLQVLAENKHAPLIGATEDGLQYLNNGITNYLSYDALKKRLKPKR